MCNRDALLYVCYKIPQAFQTKVPPDSPLDVLKNLRFNREYLGIVADDLHERVRMSSKDGCHCIPPSVCLCVCVCVSLSLSSLSLSLSRTRTYLHKSERHSYEEWMPLCATRTKNGCHCAPLVRRMDATVYERSTHYIPARNLQ